MKLYTEDEIKRTFGFGMSDIMWNGYMNAIKPIELPTDEEISVIALNIAETLKDKLDSREEAFYLSGFQTCAKWMHEQIEKQVRKELLTNIMEADQKNGLYNTNES